MYRAGRFTCVKNISQKKQNKYFDQKKFLNLNVYTAGPFGIYAVGERWVEVSPGAGGLF